MQDSKFVRILTKVLLVVVTAEVLVMAVWFVSHKGRRLLARKSVVSVSDAVSTSDETAAPVPLSLNQTSAETGKGLTFQLVAEGGDGIVFRSSDENIASVDENGLVKGTGVGQCTVTAENKDGKGKIIC